MNPSLRTNQSLAIVLAVVLVVQAHTALFADEIHKALWDKGDPAKALALLKSDKNLASVKDEDKCTPLHHAARFDHLEVVRWLVDAKVDLNPKAYNGFTPLHLTTNKTIAALLIKSGADLNIRDNWGNTPLQKAVENTNSNSGVIEAILESGYQIDLRSALWLRRSDIATKLVSMDPKILQTNDVPTHLHANATPLGIAAWLGEKELVQLFLKRGAPVNAMTHRPEAGLMSPLQNAVMAREPEIVEMLCRAGADVNTIGGKFQTGHYSFLLDYAKIHSTPQIVEILRKYNAKSSSEKTNLKGKKAEAKKPTP